MRSEKTQKEHGAVGAQPSISDVYAELGRLYHWEKPKEFFTIGSVDFDEASNWTRTYGIISRSWVLVSVIALHIAMVTGFMFIAYEWFRHGENEPGGIVFLAALTAFLHQFFYGLSSAYSDDLNNGRGFTKESVNRAIYAATRLLPFSLIPGFAIGAMFRKRIPLRMVLDRNGEMLFIGRYIHYMMCYVLAKQSARPLVWRMLDAARLSVERRHDVFDVLEGERKRYYLSGIILAIALSTQAFFLVPLVTLINIFISHVGMVWMPTIASSYAQHGGEVEKLPDGQQKTRWKVWFKVSGAIQLIVFISIAMVVGYFTLQTSREKAIAKEEYKQTLTTLPKPADELIGKWFDSVSMLNIDRIPEMSCSYAANGYACKRIYMPGSQSCYTVDNYLTRVCLHDGLPSEATLKKSEGGVMLLGSMSDAGINPGDIEFSLLSDSLYVTENGVPVVDPDRGAIFRLRDGSGSAARYGREVILYSYGVFGLRRVD